MAFSESNQNVKRVAFTEVYLKVLQRHQQSLIRSEAVSPFRENRRGLLSRKRHQPRLKFLSGAPAISAPKTSVPDRMPVFLTLQSRVNLCWTWRYV
jgi:hypothetical protein